MQTYDRSSEKAIIDAVRELTYEQYPWCDTMITYDTYDNIFNKEKEDIMMHKVCMQDMDWWMTGIDPKTKIQFIAPFFPSMISYESGSGFIKIDGRTGQPVTDRKLIKTGKNHIMGDGYFGYKKVIFNPPATIVIWNDNTKTVVKCGENDLYDPEKGLALCFMKRAFKNDNNAFHKVLNKETDFSFPSVLTQVLRQQINPEDIGLIYNKVEKCYRWPESPLKIAADKLSNAAEAMRETFFSTLDRLIREKEDKDEGKS